MWIDLYWVGFIIGFIMGALAIIIFAVSLEQNKRNAGKNGNNRNNI